jgi:hypothetical protein
MFVTLDTRGLVLALGVAQLPAVLLLMGLNTPMWVLLGITMYSELETHLFLAAVHALVVASGLALTL